MTHLDRRQALLAACAGCAAVALGGCAQQEAEEPAGEPADPDARRKPFAQLADIAVGGSISVRSPTGQRVLLARPTADTVAAFSARCTHQACTVEAAGAKFSCPCHGSTFNAATGEVLTGPAQRALPKVDVAVVNGGVVLA